ncbi:MAG: nucleoside deaminase [Bacteroidales bacterium]|nr:nucleoside deaminase [Bacteroidales bacterium]
MKNKSFLKILFLVAILFILLVLFNTRIFQILPSNKINSSEETEIIRVASKALEHMDVPVGSLIIYNGSIIGKGYNSVKSDTNIAGHAEINAINDVVKKIGLSRFDELDRDKLILVTTLEPCEMCKGAIIHYNIKHVYFMKDKSPLHWNKKQLKLLRYEWYKRKIDGEQKQDSLFLLHPEYRGNK